MIIKTERLILRPWEETDAESLFEYAQNPNVGPIAGWPVHTSVENSREIIKNVLAVPETYAVCLKEDNRAIGSIGLLSPRQSHTDAKEDELEIGYWIGEEFWGNGYIPEAVRALQEFAFNDLGCNGIWCGYYDGNEKSRRVQEKCGFVFHHTEKNKPCPLMGDTRTEHFTYCAKEVFENAQGMRQLKEMIQEELAEQVRIHELNYIRSEDAILPEYAGIQFFEEPLLEIGDVEDPLFSELKSEDVIGAHYIAPQEWLPTGKRVISIFFPFTGKIVESNAESMELPSHLWLHGRIEGQNFIGTMGKHMASFLEKKGFTSLCPSQDERFCAIYNPDQGRYTSNWSERHAAYICGLGTFGLSRGIITKKGMAGRLVSVITDAELPVTERTYHSLYERCTRCGACAKNCPVDAISLEKGKDHAPCYEMLQKSKKLFPPRLGCGKCQASVPCSRSIPAALH